MSILEPRTDPTDPVTRDRILVELGRALLEARDPPELYRTLYRETAKVLEVTGFYVSRYDPSLDIATIVFCVERGEEREMHFSYPGSRSYVIKTGRPRLVVDRDSVEFAPKPEALGPGLTRSAISAPLVSKRGILGTISAQSSAPNAYGEGELELLQGIADMAAVALDNIRRLEELDRRRAEAERIEEIGRGLGGLLDPADVLDTTINATLELLEPDGASVGLVNGHGNTRVEISRGDLIIPEGVTFSLAGAVLGEVLESARTAVIDDVAKDGVFPEELRKYHSSGSALIAPLVLEGATGGVLLAADRVPRAFGTDAVRIATRLARQASVALENARLHEHVQTLSLTDPLTGLPNRRHFEIALQREVAAAERGRPLNLILFDLDNFKACNDRHGHLAGDEVLRAFSRALVEETRAMNMAARFGGDEFVSIVSDTGEAGARRHAQRVKERVEQDPFLASHGVTVTYGVAAYEPGFMDRTEDLIDTADRDLYRKKAER